jgi:hypothetical protein
MAENNDPPRRSQPFLDVLKIINGLKQEPLSQRQQAELARLHTHLRQDTPDLDRLREMLSMSPEEAERWKQRWKEQPSASLFDEIQKAYEQWQLQQEAASEPAPETAASEPAPELAAKPTIEPAVVPIKKRPSRWSADWRRANPQGKHEDDTAYARRMCDAMRIAPDVTEAWPFDTCRRELYRKRKGTDFAPEPGSVQTFPKPH